MTATYVIGDVRACLAALPDNSVDLVLTSPPFLALRSYLPADHPDKAKEIGSEPTPAAFIDTLLALSAEWRRVLTPYGSMVVELGDTYAGSNESGWERDKGAFRSETRSAASAAGLLQGAQRTKDGWPLSKSLTLIPELYRVALAYGRNPLTGEESPAGSWRVRNVVRWVRPNPPVGALGDKFRPATSDLVVACTSGKRWFDLDAVRQPLAAKTLTVADGSAKNENSPSGHHRQIRLNNEAGAPPLDWWQISPGGFSGSHYAVWPPELCVKPIEAMCPRRVCRTCGEPSRRQVDHQRSIGAAKFGSGRPLSQGGPFSNDYEVTQETTGWSTCGCPDTDGIRLDGYHTGTGWRPGIVLDPFAGSGTTLMVATGHGRDAVGFDLDERNADLARERIGMFLDVASVADLIPGDAA